ncbi:MAG: sigma-70 family RNA polymerase sigma factor [Saprospiraceae bacterium]|nr:sigma-70 family RNA polymerase sigma factor [Saprospiraceae bacterium]
MILDPVSCDAGFRLLVMKYQESLYWHIRKLVHRHEDADDVIQNTFLKVYRNLKNFKKESKLYTWLYRIATNESITHINDRKRRASYEDGQANELKDQLKADTYFDGGEAERMMALAIAELPEKQRVVFNLRYYEEMSYNDMSQVLETSVGALKASYHHAVKKVEHYIKKAMS